MVTKEIMLPDKSNRNDYLFLQRFDITPKPFKQEWSNIFSFIQSLPLSKIMLGYFDVL